MLSCFNCVRLCNSMDHSPPGSSVHGIFQARILEWVAISYTSRIFLTHELNLCLLHLLDWWADSLPLCHLAAATAAKSLKSCPTLCDPMDGSPPGSPVPGILQARTLECCHFLLQCMKVKSESEVAQSCPTLSDPMDCSLPGSPTTGFSRQEYWSGLPLPSPYILLRLTKYHA